MFNKSWERSPRHSICFLTMMCFSPFIGLPAISVQAQEVTEVTVDLELIDNPIYYISDFDITGGGRPIDLFKCKITSDAERDVSIRVEITRSNPIPPIRLLEAQARAHLFTGDNTFYYPDFRNGKLISEGFRYNSDALSDLSNAVLRTGTLPSGQYDVKISVLFGSNPPEVTRSFIVSNPVSLDLISPGQNASMAECPMLFSALPQFTWNSDVDRFIITVCELLPTNNSPEDVMQNPPRVRMALQRNQDFFGAPTFQYPSAGLPLLPGRVYYWQVIALLKTASGEVQLPSEIWCFKIHSNDAAQNAIELQQLLTLLASLGVQDLMELFKPGGPLAGFAPTGKIRMNGKNVDLGELLALLQNGSIKIKAYNVE